MIILVVAGSIMVTVFSLYAIYTEAAYLPRVEEMVYGSSMLIGVITIIVLPPTVYYMSYLTFKVKQ